MLKYPQKKYIKEITAANARLLFAQEGTNFFHRYGWRALQFRSLLEEAHRLNCEPPLNFILRILVPFEKEGIALFEQF